MNKKIKPIKKVKKVNAVDFKKEVQRALAKVRPDLKAHGGNVRLVGVDANQGLVKVKLQGMCVGCPMADVTLQQGIAEFLKKAVKGFRKLEGV